MGCCGRVWSTLRQEFKVANLRLNHQEPHLFLASEWQDQLVVGVRPWYVVYRWAWALYHVSWCIANFLYEGGLHSPLSRKVYHFIYLTNWSYIMISVMTSVYACVITIYWLRYRRTAQLPKTISKKLKVVWFLQNMVFLPAFLITAAYWTAIYNPENPVTALNAEVHIINSVYVLIDLWVVASPLRILHFYIPFIYLSIYLFFTLIYYYAGGLTPDGGTAIYPIMDWENLSVTVPFVVCCAVFMPAMQGVVWAVYKARVKVRQSCCRASTTVGSLPHQGTMDVIIDRDASMESVAPHAPAPIISQTV